MIQSKEWNWSKVTNDIWNIPSEDIYHYLYRWSSLDFTTFLDMGCGLGRHTLLFAENGFETYGVDLSEYALLELREKSKEKELTVETQVGDINKLPYKSGKFDCLLAYHVISHTDTYGIKEVIGEIRRVLRTGGEFFVTLCSKRSPSYTKVSNIVVDSNTIIKMEEPEVGIPHYYCELDNVRNLMGDFEVIKVRHIEDIFGDSSSWHYFIHGRKK